MSASNQHNPRNRIHDLITLLRTSKVGIVGGGAFCLNLITFFKKHDLAAEKPDIIGVADINPDAVGLAYAQQLGIYTTNDYRCLYDLQGLQLILEITHNAELAHTISSSIPGKVEVIDHFDARYIWDVLQVENLKLCILERYDQQKENPGEVEALFEESFSCFNTIIGRRNDRFRQIELELVDNQRTQSQIIQGSTIPTFVIDKNHVVTHWNKALETMSGWPAHGIVGTNRQWTPFWDRERPTMADVILDQIDENEIEKLYGSQWRKSALIEGAYEAELFFPQFGEEGKWLWFTAAPIQSPDGTIVGAIETLWDKTDDVNAAEEREQHTNELVSLCSIYTALSAPWLINFRIEAALKEVQRFLNADDVVIYLQTNDDVFDLKYHYGKLFRSPTGEPLPAEMKFLREVARTGQLVTIDGLDSDQYPELAKMARLGVKSAVFIPISAKEKKIIGILQISSRYRRQFRSGESHVLDLIANRIGVAIENATLQEQYIASEEKYRSLFNNDPNPIFIIDRETLEIVDINERAEECYGYLQQELRGTSFLRLGDANDTEMDSGLRFLVLGQSILFTKKRHYKKSGEPFYVNINVSHAEYSKGSALIATSTDISETVEKETQLIQASKMTTLGLMAAGMAHEINQPLNVIQICADFFLKMLKRGKPIGDDDMRSMANDIIDNVERATGIIRHVRDFARQSEVIKSKINVNAPIEDVFKVLGHQIKTHQIELELELQPDIPYIMADHNRLEQVFINLVTNAIDAMDEKVEQPEYTGRPKRLQIRTYAENNNVIVRVTDNGIGMSEDVKSKLFEPFFTTKKVGKGTGLGVSISYGIVKDYEGVFDIESRPGHGTTFKLTFPVSSQIAS